MKAVAIILISLLCLFLVITALACCKVSGDAEKDAETCYEEWLKSKKADSSSQ